MKDYVFIGWSENKDLAICIKNILDEEGFICVVGGEYENNPPNVETKKTVHETVINQMNHCNQAILLFQKLNKNDLSISGNLIYELGYLSALYNPIDSYTKVHIFKINMTEKDDYLFPTNLRGIWGTNISIPNTTNEEIAKKICDSFKRKQKQIMKKVKFEILNDHHFVEYEMSKHFETPTISDYDLAEEIIVYLQSAFCYQEQTDIKQKIEEFKMKIDEKKNNSKELNWSVNYALLTLNLFCFSAPDEDGNRPTMDKHTFIKLLNKYKSIGKNVVINIFQNHIKQQEQELEQQQEQELEQEQEQQQEQEQEQQQQEQEQQQEHTAQKSFNIKLHLENNFVSHNHFEALLIGQMQEHITYLIYVYLLNNNIETEEKRTYSNIGIEYCKASIHNLELLKEYPEYEMYVNLLLSYAYKNLATFNAYLDIDTNECKNKSLEIRSELNMYVNNTPTIRLSLKDYIGLEYFYQVIDIINNSKDLDKSYHLSEIEQFIDKLNKSNKVRNFMIDDLARKYNEMKWI